jgi:hypothetical protein
MVTKCAKNLQESGCPRNLYNFTKNYFSQRKATLATNNITIEGAVIKGPTRVLSRAWYVEHLLQLAIKLKVHERYKNSSICRHLITNKREVGERGRKYSQYRAEKVSMWAKENKVRFNDQKSKAMLMTRRKKTERTWKYI